MVHNPCKDCGTDDSSEFYVKNTRVCKDCQRNRFMLKRYGVAPEEYDAMLVVSCGTCYICGGVCPDGRALGIDHDHTSEKIRGLLCYRCNTGISYLGDTAEGVQRAYAYLT